MEENKIKNKDVAVTDNEISQIKQEDSIYQNNCKFDISNENFIKNFNEQNNIVQDNENQKKENKTYEKSEYNISNMTENQLKYASNLIEKIKNRQSE